MLEWEPGQFKYLELECLAELTLDLSGYRGCILSSGWTPRGVWPVFSICFPLWTEPSLTTLNVDPNSRLRPDPRSAMTSDPSPRPILGFPLSVSFHTETLHTSFAVPKLCAFTLSPRPVMWACPHLHIAKPVAICLLSSSLF